MWCQDRNGGDVLVVEESISRLHFRAAIATGGKLEGRFVDHRFQHHLKAFLEPGIAGLGLASLDLAGLPRAEFRGSRFTIDPIDHGTIRWQGPSSVLVGLCSVPGSREFIESSYTEKTRCNYLLYLFYPVLGKSAGNDEGNALGIRSE